MPSSKPVYVDADFPGATVQDALEGAEAELASLPFEVEWSEIRLKNVYADEEQEGTWIATLKARGHSRS